jgi:hypothetical protein
LEVGVTAVTAVTVVTTGFALAAPSNAPGGLKAAGKVLMVFRFSADKWKAVAGNNLRRSRQTSEADVAMSSHREDCRLRLGLLSLLSAARDKPR